MNILFTGVGRRIELIQAFRSAAETLRKNLKIYGADMTETAPALAYCDGTRIVTGMKEPGYVDELLTICKEDEIDLLIPTIDTDLLILSENKERFEEIGTRVMISEPDQVRIGRDKTLSARFLKKCGFFTPVTVDDWKEYKSGFPAFIKPRDGSSSIGAFKVQNAEELKIYAAHLENYIVQPFVSGIEYTIDVFCDWNGNPLSIVPRERLKVRDGEVLKTRIRMDKAILEEAEKICSAYRPCGAVSIQLIRDAEGTDWFIEINPRFGGGAPLSMRAGARSAESVLRLLDGEPAERYTVADGAIYSRFDQAVCIDPGKRTSVKGVIFDLDDTLYSEKEYVWSGYNEVSDFFGGGYTSELYHFFLNGKPAIDELMRETGHEEEKDEAVEVYRHHKPDLHLYDGVAELISELKSKNIRVGIITDGRPEGQRNKLEALGLYDMMDDIIITDELGGKQFRKPCDIAFRIMLTRWRLNPADVVYVGDNAAKDSQAPRQLGMRFLWFDNEEGLYRSEKQEGYNSISAIRDVLIGGGDE